MELENKKIITRFAPSPTGELHIGGARTALFAYMFAKSQGGEFLLRIEDTDRTRFVEGSVERIIESLNWLGIIPDNQEKIMVQSERKEIYLKYAKELVENGHAYICTCSKETLTAEREKQQKAGLPPKYPGFCREKGVKFEDVKEGEYVVRMKMPQSGKIVVNDLILGEVEFDLALMDDQVLMKSDGFPTYHLAVIVDDHEMAVSHVIRAVEWLPSTPKHLVLYENFGWEKPEYAHLPMVLATDRSKLSKRHGATSVTEFKDLGYLPEAIINFLALQGWNPKNNQEFFGMDTILKEFKLTDVNKAPAIFDIDKLNYINEHYLRNKTSEELQELISKFGVSSVTEDEATLIKRGGYKTLKEASDYINEIRLEPNYDPSLLIFKKSDKETTLKALKILESRIENHELWETDLIQEVLANIVSENNLTNGDVFWPLRVALSGKEKSPSPVELMIVLGKTETAKRIKKAIGIL